VRWIRWGDDAVIGDAIGGWLFEAISVHTGRSVLAEFGVAPMEQPVGWRRALLEFTVGFTVWVAAFALLGIGLYLLMGAL
jgi:hypothetical protein